MFCVCYDGTKVSWLDNNPNENNGKKKNTTERHVFVEKQSAMLF